MKTPEEIKKGLEWSATTDITKKVGMAKKGLPYAYSEELASDALEYIIELEQRLAQAERERDAAVRELEIAEDCYNCKYNYACKHDGNGYRKCSECGECPCITYDEDGNRVGNVAMVKACETRKALKRIGLSENGIGMDCPYQMLMGRDKA